MPKGVQTALWWFKEGVRQAGVTEPEKRAPRG